MLLSFFAHRLGPQATWAEVVLAGGLRYQNIIGWELFLMLQLKFPERLRALA